MVRIKGFSLIEIIIAVAIFAIVSVYMMRVLDEGHYYSRKLKMRTIAYFLAQEKMEELSTDSDYTLFSNPNSHDEAKAQVDSDYPDFDREVDVTCPYLGFNNLAKISVTVYWQGYRGERSFVLESLVANF